VFVFCVFYAFFKLVEVTMGNRVSAKAELEGLDVPEMGVLGYPDFVIAPGMEGTAPAAAAAHVGGSAHVVLQPVAEKS
jgi:hypothetical protein